MIVDDTTKMLHGCHCIGNEIIVVDLTGTMYVALDATIDEVA